MQRCVATVNFHEVVNQKHGDDAQRIDRFRRVWSEQEGEQRDVPAMLGRILAARTVRDPASTKHCLQSVHFEQEAQSAGQLNIKLAEPAFGAMQG